MLRPWPLRRCVLGAIISSSSPITRAGFCEVEVGEGLRKRLTSPIIRVGVSNSPGVRVSDGIAGVDGVVDERGKQAMNVSLSASVRQLRCMAYSSSRVRGSEAVSAWMCWEGGVNWGPGERGN